MKSSPLTILAVFVAASISIGCSHSEEANTAPLPLKDPQASLESATQQIGSSNMSPEQKKAAIDYMKRSATNAQQAKQQAAGH